MTCPAAAEDRGPTVEQVTERDVGLAALWQALRDGTAGMRVAVGQSLVSSGEFDGVRLSWFRTEAGIQGGIPLAEGFNLGIAPSFAWERLTVDGNDDFVVSQSGRDIRFTDFYDTSLRIGASYTIDDEWAIEAVSGWSARHESGADVSDASQVGGSLAVNYRRGNWLRLRLGVGIGADLDDRQIRFSPVYRIVIRPAPGWSIESSGLGGSIEWEATSRMTLAIGGQANGTQYRLDRRGRPPTGAGDALLQRRQARVDLRWIHRFTQNLRLRVGIGCVLDEELEVTDGDGVTTDTRRNRDPSVTLGVGLDLRL